MQRLARKTLTLETPVRIRVVPRNSFFLLILFFFVFLCFFFSFFLSFSFSFDAQQVLADDACDSRGGLYERADKTRTRILSENQRNSNDASCDGGQCWLHSSSASDAESSDSTCGDFLLLRSAALAAWGGIVARPATAAAAAAACPFLPRVRYCS